MMEAQASQIKKRTHPLRRLGCGLLLICWFVLLLTPCALFYLAANGEIRFWHGEDVPQPHAHPRLLVSLISDADHRGLRIESSSPLADSTDENALCLQTRVRFVLWESNEGSQDTAYCDCYRRTDVEAAWILEDTFGGACQK